MSNEPSKHDAATRLLADLRSRLAEHQRNTAELGKLCFLLRALYSERANSSGRRTSPGHGVYCDELKKLGIPRQRAAEWVRDHEITLGLRKPSESTTAKRQARRRTADADVFNAFKATGGLDPVNDPLGYFVALLPFEALQAAYRAAAKQFHPDLGGDSAEMQRLNDAWALVEQHFESEGRTVIPEDGAVST